MADQMGTFYLSRQQRIGFKLETNPGTPEALSDADYNLLAFNLKLSNATEENIRKYAVGDPYPFKSVMGRRPVNISFTIHVQGSGGSGVPAYFKLLAAAAFKLWSETNSSPLPSWQHASLRLPGAPGTFEVQEVQSAATSPTGKQYTIKGCCATKCVFAFDNAGELIRIDLEYIGAMYNVADLANGAINTPVLDDDDSVPPAVLGVDYNYRDVLVPAQGMTIDMGLKTELIQWPQDPTGFSHAVVGDFDPIVNFSPLIEPESQQPYFDDLKNEGTVGIFEVKTLPATVGQQMRLYMAAAQVVKALDLEQRSMIDSTTVMLRALRTLGYLDPPNDDFVFVLSQLIESE